MNIDNQILQVPLDDITPNQFQPRTNFDTNELEQLAQSIKENGIIQPLVLRKMGAKYEIIAGERRYRAAKMAGLTTVPAIISNVDDKTSAEFALVENVQRSDLSAIEEARSYQNLINKGYTQDQLAKKMGVSQPSIANKLRLLNLAEEVQQALVAGKISERHARSLLAVKDKEQQKEWLNRIINERLTVRQLDIEIKKSNNIDQQADIPLVSTSLNIDNIKNNSSDITPITNRPASSNNTFFTFDSNNNSNTAPINELENNPITPSNSTNKTPNKFFNFLEDEAVNMDSLVEGDSIFSFTPPPANTPEQPQTENKFFNFQEPSVSETLEPQKPDMTLKNEETKPILEEDEDVETLFDPMDQVEILDPDYEKKLQQEAGLDLKTAIRETRDAIMALQAKGFNIQIEETDLDKQYQFIIKINKE